jgi:peptide/nickel transport system permease protein
MTRPAPAFNHLARYVTLRLLRALATVMSVVTLVFLLIHLVPGDPVDAMLGDQAAPEDRLALRRLLRLDAPLSTQYAAFLGDIGNGTLGHSFRTRGRTVASMILEAYPDTLALAGCAMLVALLFALPMGVLAAAKRDTYWDRAVSTVAMLGVAVPHIWLGPLLVLLFGVVLRWLPMPGDDEGGLRGLILPSVTLGSALCAMLMRQTRGALLEVLREPYIRAAHARGLAPHVVLFKHALRNALLPVVTVAAAQLGALLSGAVVAEKIFERHGLGTLFLDAFFDRDFPVIQGAVLVTAMTYVLVNLCVDLLYGVIDPRATTR